ncbi:MAG: TonB family protein [Deltaproteobacteria bacterium]|nr:TonB family protein [Deltaproteobacteria bacterium]
MNGFKKIVVFSAALHAAIFGIAVAGTWSPRAVESKVAGLGHVMITFAGAERGATKEQKASPAPEVASVLSSAVIKDASPAASEAVAVVAGRVDGISGYSGKGELSDDAMKNFKSMVVSAIEKAKFYPRWARERGYEGTVGVSFTVKPDGKVEGVSVNKPCHCNALNVAAVEIVAKAAPFLKRPGALDGRDIPMNVSIAFALD